MGRFRIALGSCLMLLLLVAAGCSDDEEVSCSTSLSSGKKDLELRFSNGVTMKLTLIPAGTFLMGSPDRKTYYEDAQGERPHEVTISKPFYMGIHEVTQAQWRAVMGTEPWVGKYLAKSDPDNPASWVTWDDATAFCEALSKKTGKKVSLPTEAQWEYACRAGSKTVYCFGDDPSKLGDYAWYKRNAYGKGLNPWDKDAMYTRPVGQKKPNAFGLYDMHGNVWEWCRDWYDVMFYVKAKNVDPENTKKAKYRVLRGGAWFSLSEDCRAATRFSESADSGYDYTGLRVIIPANSVN